MKFWSKVLAITWKDTISEMRTKEIVFSVLVFTLLVIVIFNFAFAASQEQMNAVAPGILWATFTFAGVLSLQRSFVPEKDQGCLEGLMVCPVSREVIYFGKLLGSLLFMLIIEAIAIPVFTVLFNIPLISFQIILITVLTTVGFVSVGTLFSALAVNTKARDMVLPILFLPIVIPLVISAVKASGIVLTGDASGNIMTWLAIIIAFDAVYLVVSYWVFNLILEE